MDPGSESDEKPAAPARARGGWISKTRIDWASRNIRLWDLLDEREQYRSVLFSEENKHWKTLLKGSSTGLSKNECYMLLSKDFFSMDEEIWRREDAKRDPDKYCRAFKAHINGLRDKYRQAAETLGPETACLRYEDFKSDTKAVEQLKSILTKCPWWQRAHKYWRTSNWNPYYNPTQPVGASAVQKKKKKNSDVIDVDELSDSEEPVRDSQSGAITAEPQASQEAGPRRSQRGTKRKSRPDEDEDNVPPTSQKSAGPSQLTEQQHELEMAQLKLKRQRLDIELLEKKAEAQRLELELEERRRTTETERAREKERHERIMKMMDMIGPMMDPNKV